MKRQRLTGFTLVELLVVITVIFILAALLLPALARSKQQAQQTVCLSNIKQLTYAGLMYIQDNVQGIPENAPGNPGYDQDAPACWWDALPNYNITSNVTLCPSTRALPLLPADAFSVGTANLPWIDWDTSVNQSESSSYGLNGYLYQLITAYVNLPVTKSPDLFIKANTQYPSKTPFFFDETFIDTFPLESDLSAMDLYSGGSATSGGGRGMSCCTILRHGGRTASGSVPYKSGNPIPGAINMGFDDGHAELAKLQNLWTYTWHLNWNPAAVKGP